MKNKVFDVRTAPWEGIGKDVKGAFTANEVLRMSGLDWNVIQRDIFTDINMQVKGFKVNMRSTDNRVLGVVTDRYQVVQNEEAFRFTEALLGEGVIYETAGCVQWGKRVWILAKFPKTFRVVDEDVCSYMVFSNSHDGSVAIKVAMTPIRVICQNTLNLALDKASRIWSTVHKGNIHHKLDDARISLLRAHEYMHYFNKEAENLYNIKLSDKKVQEYINRIIPLKEDATPTHERNVIKLREDLKMRYFEAPDLKILPKNGWRFINAASDFATHSEPIRKTTNYRENLFIKTIEGNAIIDGAYLLLKNTA